MYSWQGTLAKQTKAQFRHSVSILKKAGIIDIKDASKAEPFMVRKAGPRGGVYTLRELVDKYDNIISGKATTVKLSPTETKKQVKLGAEKTRGGRVVVPKSAGDRVRVSPQGKVIIDHPSGIHRIQETVEYEGELVPYLEKLKADAKKINRMKKKGERIAFNFYGNRSIITYGSIDDAIETIMEYKTFTEAINKHSSREMNEIYRNLEFVSTTGPAWKRAKELTRQQREKNKKDKEPKKQKRSGRRSRKVHDAAYKREHAEEMRKYRASLSPVKKEAYKAKARARAKKSRS